MAKFSVTILWLILLQLISGTYSRPENYGFSEEQKLNLRKIAKQWAAATNSKKEPCEDFYTFVCSDNKFPMHDYNDSQKHLQNILNGNPKSITKAEEKFLKYSKCDEFTEKEKKDFIKTFKFEKSIGNWPAFVEKWDDSKFDLSLAIAEMNLYNYPVIFQQTFIFDDDNFQTALLIGVQSQEVDIETKVILKELFKNLGVKNPDEVLNDAALFQKIYNEAAESLDVTTDKRIKFLELKEFLPEIDWDKLIKIIYGKELPDNYSVLLKSHEKLKKICKAITKLSSKTIANYFFYKFVHSIKYEIYPDAFMTFMPVTKQMLLKYVYGQNTLNMVKGMYITALKIAQDPNVVQYFKRNYDSSEQIIKFPAEEIFQILNEGDLEKLLINVTANSNQCLTNYHRLQIINKRIQSKAFFNSESVLTTRVMNAISNEVLFIIPHIIKEPSPVIFSRILYSILYTMFTFNDVHLKTIRPTTEECFADKNELEIILKSQLILKAFKEWTKDYPHFVQEENNILKGYGLSAEKLLAICTVKVYCNEQTRYSVVTAFANSVEFTQIYNCPAGSKMNSLHKCSFF